MAKSRMNLVIRGYIGKVGELRYTPAGKEVMNFSVGVSFPSNRTSPDGKTEYDTTWFNCTLWGKAALDYPGDSLAKGMMVEVEVKRLSARAYSPSNGGEPQAQLECPLVGYVDILSEGNNAGSRTDSTYPRTQGNGRAASSYNETISPDELSWDDMAY